MKTIDEVISFLEDRQKTEDWNVRDDAIQHLREFKELIKMWNDKLDKEQENPPLTWEQLKQMEGKPVFVEVNDGEFKKWFIVGHFFSWFEKEDFDAHVNLYKCGGAMEFCKESYGDWWRAYRKEK